MKIVDRLYGNFEINEPVLLELIESQPMQRLKGISQMGIPAEFRAGRGLLEDFSRYEHSLGVMLLLRRVRASLEEQVAGLLHDVSHTAFSHLYDWVAYDHTSPNPAEDLQDKRHLEYVAKPEISGILMHHGFDPLKIADAHQYNLLEQGQPDLCADRIDYMLRMAGHAGDFVEHLGIDGNRLVFIDSRRALAFGQKFLAVKDSGWANYEMTALYFWFAQVLRWALEAGTITEADFDQDDRHVLKLITQSREPLIRRSLEVLRRHPIPKSKNGVKLYDKFRRVDPLVRFGGHLKRTSDVFPEFQSQLLSAKDKNAEGYLVPTLADLL